VVRRRVVALGTLFVVLAMAISASGSSWPPPRLASASRPDRAHARANRSRDVPGSSWRPAFLRNPSDERQLTLTKSISGHISPKSVAASGSGLVFAQNMMYTHTVTVYNRAGSLLRTIPDTVSLGQFGIAGHPGVSHGAPVEASFSPDGRYAYVSNYSMYGSGFGPEGNDACTPASARAAGDTNSYVYRINTSTLSIDRVIGVGLVPKYLTVTPDGRYLLVANWCSYDVSVVSLSTGREVARVPVGPYPRGLAVAPDSRTAYIAIMGGDNVVRLNLRTLQTFGSFSVGAHPRHLVIDPSGRFLYASLNGPGDVVKVDLTSGAVVKTVHTGDECRSLAIAPDGRALYVVNYSSNTVTKLRASDLGVIQTVDTGVHPVGIAYDAASANVWVAVYSGQILVFADRPR